MVKAADSDTGICVCKPDFYEELFEGKEGELIVKCAPCHGTCNGCTGSEAH